MVDHAFITFIFCNFCNLSTLGLTNLKLHEGGDNQAMSPCRHPGQRHVAELGVEVVVADGPEVAVSAGQVLSHAHRVREAQVVKLQHN